MSQLIHINNCLSYVAIAVVLTIDMSAYIIDCRMLKHCIKILSSYLFFSLFRVSFFLFIKKNNRMIKRSVNVLFLNQQMKSAGECSLFNGTNQRKVRNFLKHAELTTMVHMFNSTQSLFYLKNIF